MRKINILLALMFMCTIASAQDKGVLSGNFQSNFSIFDLDSSIGAFESPQYISEVSSAEAWLYLNYEIKGFFLSESFEMLSMINGNYVKNFISSVVI